ncbi:MAG: CvpA family protein [Desulfobacula sp.]|nr:CvpA family protein [Desulfobacula sp.]
MNAFDILVVIIVAFCLIRGVFKGLIGEVSGIIGVVAAFYGAYTYYPLITVYAEKWIENSEFRNILAFFLIFCAILIVVGLVSLLIRKILNLVFLGWVDRTFGLVFGAAKGVLIVSVIFIMITSFFPENSKILTTSKFSPYIAKVSETLTVFVSKNSRQDFLKKLEGIINWKQ